MRLRLQHSLDMGKTWENRGIVALTRSKSGNGAVNQVNKVSGLYITDRIAGIYVLKNTMVGGGRVVAGKWPLG